MPVLIPIAIPKLESWNHPDAELSEYDQLALNPHSNSVELPNLAITFACG